MVQMRMVGLKVKYVIGSYVGDGFGYFLLTPHGINCHNAFDLPGYVLQPLDAHFLQHLEVQNLKTSAQRCRAKQSC